MLRRSSAFACLMALWPLAVVAQDTGCGTVVAGLQRFVAGYELTDPRPVLVEGWCRIDGAVFKGKAKDAPEIRAKTLRLRGVGVNGALTALEVEATGIKVAPKIGDRAMDARMRSFLRLQTAELALSADWDKDADVLAIRELVLTLPGRNRLTLSARIEGADLSGASALLGGAVTSLGLELVTDGRVARPVVQALGTRLVPEGADEGQAVLAVRALLGEVVEAMPAATLDRESRFALSAMVAGLPQTTGTLKLVLAAEDGISPARVALNGLRKEPLSKAALATLFEGVTLSADWAPGAVQ
jgi:hypothetical protein